MKNEFITPFSKLKNPTGKHKDWYGIEFIKIFLSEINSDNREFKNEDFIRSYKAKYKNLELKERLNLIAQIFDKLHKGSYRAKLKTLAKVLGPELPFEEGMFKICFFLYPVSQFIEIYGESDLNESLKFIEELTKRFTGEWAIRPLANLDEKKVLAQMKKWAKHENFHVRRLASEGLRARLPWGKKIDWVCKDPKKTIPIYNLLRNDPVLYVRRSVANSMGDIIKIDEDLALKTLNSWLDRKKTPENIWVISHAIRTPVKKKNKKFISLKKKLECF